MNRDNLDTRPYWEALQQKRLVIQQCGDCGRYRHYPQPMCPHCHSTEIHWRDVSAKGHLHSWTITYQTGIPEFSHQVPYIFATVDLLEGVRMAAPLRQIGPDELKLGLPVMLTFETAADGQVRPAFRPG